MKISRRRLLRFLLVLSILLPLLAACSSKPNQPTKVVGKEETRQPTQTMDLSKGKVVGAIKLKGKPVPSVALGLGNLLKDAQGLELVTSYDRTFSPQTDTQADGSFTFMNVKPGSYGLIYANEPETYLLLKPGDPNIQEAILITVTAGQTVDLGVLDFSGLPGQ